MPILIRDIKTKETFWHLRELAIAVRDVWGYDLYSSNAESNAEYDLAVAKSHRIEDELNELEMIDLELNPGRKKIEFKKGLSIMTETGYSNPWYNGDLTIDELLQALLDLYMSWLGVEPMDEPEIKFIYHYQEIEKAFEKINPKKFHRYIPDTFWETIHSDIQKIAKPRFESGQYADAVEASLKHVNAKVKNIAKGKMKDELDGAKLMCHVFSTKEPVITLADLTTETGRNIQVGFMQIFAGSMTGIRNPKAHNNVEIDKSRAIHFLFLSSLLSFKLDEKKRK